MGGSLLCLCNPIFNISQSGHLPDELLLDICLFHGGCQVGSVAVTQFLDRINTGSFSSSEYSSPRP